MNVLRGRIVSSAFRPPGEEKRHLLDFVDEAQVDRMRDTLKENIQALQVIIILAFSCALLPIALYSLGGLRCDRSEVSCMRLILTNSISSRQHSSLSIKTFFSSKPTYVPSKISYRPLLRPYHPLSRRAARRFYICYHP
jgi:hypothetical protein